MGKPNKELYKTYTRRTVCEVTREIFDVLNESNIDKTTYDKIHSLLTEQLEMQKKMDARLRYYKENYEPDLFEKNTNIFAKFRKRTLAYLWSLVK
jgi:hypothetical protein